MRDGHTGQYYIHSNTPFFSIHELLSYYKTTPINSEVNTRLVSPVLSKQQQKQLAKQSTLDNDTYVIMERGKLLPLSLNTLVTHGYPYP